MTVINQYSETGMRNKKNLIWRLWCYSLGQKHGKNDTEADIVSVIRSVIFVTYLITNCFIVAGVIRHWNSSDEIQVNIKYDELPAAFKLKEINHLNLNK
jgi:hypothetical protein